MSSVHCRSRSVGFLFLVLALLIRGATDAENVLDGNVEEISAAGFIAIRTAAQELESRSIPVDGYSISVWRSSSSAMVSFNDPKGCEPGTRGNCGDMPGFEVALTPDGKQVIKAAFVR